MYINFHDNTAFYGKDGRNFIWSVIEVVSRIQWYWISLSRMCFEKLKWLNVYCWSLLNATQSVSFKYFPDVPANAYIEVYCYMLLVCIICRTVVLSCKLVKTVIILQNNSRIYVLTHTDYFYCNHDLHILDWFCCYFHVWSKFLTIWYFWVHIFLKGKTILKV